MLTGINVVKLKNTIGLKTSLRSLMRNYKHVKSCNEDRKYLPKTDSSSNNIKCTVFEV